MSYTFTLQEQAALRAAFTECPQELIDTRVKGVSFV